jgi:hypothetical protein
MPHDVPEMARTSCRPSRLVPRNALVFRFKDKAALDSANCTDASQPSDMGACCAVLTESDIKTGGRTCGAGLKLGRIAK